MADEYTPIFDETAATRLAIASREGNTEAETEFNRDMRLLPIQVLERKYGSEVASQKNNYTEARDEQFRINNTERDPALAVTDTALGAASGFVGVVGGVGSLAVGAVGKADEYFNPENTGLSEFATGLAETTDIATGAIRSLQSQDLKDRQGASGIQAQIDADENAEQYDRDTEGRDANFVDSLAWFGRGTLNNAGRILSDGVVATDVVAQGIGSLGPSAKIASVASQLVTRTSSYNAAKIANAIAPTQGTRFLSLGADAVNRSAIAAGVGLAEGSGVYTSTVNEVLKRSHGSLLDTSEEYVDLIKRGVDPDDAKAQVASHAGMDAFGRQFPTAMALGLVTARFEAAPMESFRGSGFIGGLRSVGAQTLEEGSQGLTGRLSQNIAIRDRVDPSQEITEGIDEEFVTGAIAGAGMSGVLATPSAVSNTPRAITQGVRDISGSDVGAKLASAAATGLDSISRGATSAATSTAGQVVVTGAKTVAKVTNKVVTPVADRAITAVEDFNTRPDQTIQTENLQHAASIDQLAEAELNTPPASDAKPEVRAAVEALSRTPIETPVSTGFKDQVPEGGSLIDNITGVMTTFAQKGFRINRMSDEDTLYASEQFIAFRNSTTNLPVAIRNKVRKVLTSPDFKAIQKRAAAIDLNKTQNVSTDVTDTTVVETASVAKTNPGNVNPDVVKKILEQDDRTDLTPETINIMQGAQKVSTAINTHIGDQVTFKTEESVELTRIAQERGTEAKAVKIPLFEAISRNIAVGGLKDGRGKKLRSINDFARDIFAGAQSDDGKFINEEGLSVPVKIVAEQFGMFSTHMINKVGALNTSYDNRDANGNGTTERYVSLSQGRRMVGPDSTAAGVPMTYRSKSPGSVSFARQVHADATVAVEVYNALVQTFPDQFPNGELSVPELRGFETQPSSDELDVILKDDEPDEVVTSQDDISEEASPTAVDEEAGAVEAQAETVSDSEETQDASEVSEEIETKEKTISDKDFSNVNSKFTEGFISRDNEIEYTDGGDLLNMVAEREGNEGFVEFSKLHLIDLMAKANDRLATMKTNKSDTLSIKERILAGEDTTTYRRNKNTIMVDQTTGEYDPDLLSIAAVAVLDWLTSVRSSNPSQLQDTMEQMGVTFSDLTDENIQDIMFGVPPRDVAETLAKTVVRMWGLRINKDVPMVDARGAAEGMVKELLESFIALETNLIETKMTPFFDKKSNKMVEQATYNVRPMQEMQQAIGITGQGAITKMLAPEFDTMPSIGEMVGEVDQTQSHGDVPLSKLEKIALKNMQDTPHMIADEFSNMVSLIGYDAIADFLGRKPSTDLGDRHPLKASIEGKNLSVERDFQEAMTVVDGIRSGSDAEGFPSVFYKIGISRVGRHQFKGINPQNNKILRAMVTPTHAVLDMLNNKTHQKNFWLTVAQASGLNKVENEKHNKILSEIQGTFTNKYGNAVELVEAHLNGAEIDGAALTAAMGGSGDMQTLAAVFAVAGLNKATADGTLDVFNTTLSFELDGKTDGPANMMANFGQGVLTALDFENFKRVGFFLGSKSMTLNKYFENDTGDLYETTSKNGVARLYADIAEAAPDEKGRLYAMARFATAFGDLEYVDGKFEMTRTTAKNPMTKTVYGSSQRGVGQGLASDMAMKMYQTLIDSPDGIKLYVGGQTAFEQDFEMLFNTPFPKDVDWKKSYLDSKSMEEFTKLTTSTLGKILSDTAKSVIGDPITEVNDTLVLMTAFQTEFLTEKFQELLEAKLQQRVDEGKLGTNKQGKPNRQEMTQRDYDDVVAQIREYSPTYANGMQTLDIGSLTPSDSGVKLSEAMDGALQMASSMITPDLAGVKAIPYITQGRGDAMMMNRIYGSDNAPTGTLNVFDGIDMSIDKISDYAQTINQSVLANWDADVLGDVVSDFTGFFEKTAEDKDLLSAAWGRALEGAKKKQSTSTAFSPETLVGNLHEMRRLNQARKTVFKRIGLSVDHMGGSDTAFVRGDDKELNMGQINNLISAELNLPVPVEKETVDNSDEPIQDQRTPEEGEFSQIVVTDAQTVMISLLHETKKKHVQATVRVLQKSLPLNTRIVIGSAEEVTAWYTENVGQMGKTVVDKKGIYDPANNVLLITDNNHETMTHELIHAATFGMLEDHFNSGIANDTVSRLDTLMAEFLEMDFSNSNKRVRDAANSAKAQILTLQTKTDAFSKAAALNEFMAWTLSNEALMKELKVTKTGTLAKLTKTVKALMQRLLGGVPTDMFTNILFNTELLITGNDVSGDTGNGGSGDGNDGGELTPAAHNMSNFWIDLARERLAQAGVADGNRGEKIAQLSEYRDNAKAALTSLDFGGFNLNAYQKETFKAIHTVLAMEMRLDTQSSIALNDLFTFITDNLTPEMFGPNNTQDRFSSVMNLFGASKNDEGVSDAIAVLLALSQTSDGFRRALDQLPTPPNEKGIDTSSLNEFLSSVTGMMMNKAVGSIDTTDGDMKATLDKLSESILHEDSEKEFRVLAGLMQNITKADEFLSGGFKQLAGYTEEKNREVQESNRTRLTKFVVGSVTSATAFLDEDRAKIQAEGLKRVTHMGKALDWAVPVREMVTEMIGTDGSNQFLVALLDRTNFAVSSVRQNFREDLPVILQNEFETHPDANQWKATHNVLGKTDFANVFSLANANSSFRLISDEGFLDKKIAQSEAAIQSAFTNTIAVNILEKGQQLADYMNGKGAGFQLWKNAHAINMLAGNYTSSMTKEIDKLVSLYALKGSDAKQRIEITQMYKADPEAMKSLVVYSQALNREEDLKIISETAKMNGYKGYIPDQGQKGTKTVIADDTRRDALEKQGYVRVGDATADEKYSLTSRGYYTTTTKQTGTYSQGIMQTVQDTFRGVDATTGLSVNGSTSGVIAGDAVETITNELNSALTVSNPKEVLIPVFDDSGVVYYERALNPDVIEQYQAPKSNMALMLGSWAGRQVEEKFAQQYNAELITELKRIYDSREHNDDDLYVNLPAEAEALKVYNDANKTQQKHMYKPDPVFVESWNVISPQTKKAIEEVFGEDQFFVRKDQMNLSLGYRDPSVIDMWTGDTRIPKVIQEGVQALSASIMGKTAMKKMAAIEGGVQGVVSTAKDLIVVRSLVVPYMNTQANVFQLQTRGIPIKQMWKKYPDKLAEIEQFNVNVKKLIELETRIQLAGTDKNRVAVLQQQKTTIEDQNTRFSIAPLVTAGAYKNISEGITDLDVELTSGKVGEWIESQVNKLPGSVQTIAKYGILSKDTIIYKGANKAVQYGDFIAKTIYYDHLLNEENLDHDAAMKRVNEEFVNFSVLPGRTRSYLDGIGATWFLTFKLRIAKIAMNQIRENPTRALITGTFVHDSPISDNIATVIAEDRIGYSLGWEMLFGSAGLNPWLNVTDWADIR